MRKALCALILGLSFVLFSFWGGTWLFNAVSEPYQLPAALTSILVFFAGALIVVWSSAMVEDSK